MPRRVTVTNLSDGGLLYWLVRLYAFAALALAAMLAFAALALYVGFARQLPRLPDLATYARVAPGVTTLIAGDGSLVGELATERREIVPFDRIPHMLVRAFIATEDRRFYRHAGVDVRG